MENEIEKTFKNFGLSISYGIAVCPKESRNAQELIQIADRKMYKMKQKKKGTAKEPLTS